MQWIRSSKCGDGEDACVEVGFDPAWDTAGYVVCVRSSEVPGEVVWFSAAEWIAFVAGAKDGEFDY